MKIKNGFVLKEVNGKSIVVATGEASRYFKGMLTLNEMGKRIFTALQTETNESRIADEIMEEYDVERFVVLSDVQYFIRQLRSMNVIED
ncbi:MAG: PqqD family protein [Candidatus Borkfalkiaceae bacterium]|nr:PqqD family protein [Christensenellaceae bacterium]